MKTILYITSTLQRVGPIRQLYNIIRNLERSEFKVHIITLSVEPEDSLWGDYCNLGVSLNCLNLSRFSGFFLARHRILSLVKSIKPDLVHTQGLRADILSVSILDDTPKVATVRNFPQLDYPFTYGAFKGRFMAKKHVAALKKIDQVVAVSDAVSLNLNKEFLLFNPLTIHNGVDTDVFRPVSIMDKVFLRGKLNLPSDGVIWVCSGNLTARKDPLFLLNSWKGLINAKDQHLLFLGTGELLDSCLIAAKGTANIHFAGNVENINEYLQASDVYVSASHAEGFPNAALEAMACGLPVLLSGIDPHMEILAADSSVGCDFELGSASSFLCCVDFLRKADRPTLGYASLRLINANFSALSMSVNYQNLYKTLLQVKDLYV